MTAAEYRAQKTAKPSKYRNKPVVVSGRRFASRAEANRDIELALCEHLGEIRDLKRQPRFPLIVNGAVVGTYVADWQYTVVNPTIIYRVVEDKKGFATPEFKLKWKLVQALYPEISEWRLS